MIESTNSASAEQANESSPAPKLPLIELSPSCGVRQLADLLKVSPIDIIKQLMRHGIMANINQVIDYEAAASIASAIGYEARPAPVTAPEIASGNMKRYRQIQDEEPGDLKPRPPVVTVMGHVNHGKTRLLDVIRETNVMDTEAGSITQHIGAYQVTVNGQKITFLDTPGHEAFTAMRARGAQVTDITILVVAADDGVMPQTLEAIDHARAAGVPIVVAINKIDKPNSNPDHVKQQLADAGLITEEWGGDTICLAISAKDKQGIPELLENLLIVAEMEDLKADSSRPAVGIVIEAEMDKTKGPLATVLVHDGTLSVGDTIVVGPIWGRVKAMFNDSGKRVRKAEPSSPVEILGLSSVPQVGEMLTAVANERQAQSLIEKHKLAAQQEPAMAPKSMNLDNLFTQISAGRVKELNVILKTDVQGSVEPIRSSLEQLSTEEVQVRFIRGGTGNVTESDVMLAIASKGLILGFSVNATLGARKLAEIEGISIRFYDVIYNLIDDVEKALKGMLEPTYVEVIEGRAEIRAVFASGKKLNIAGVYITEGKVTRGTPVRVRRGEKVVNESTVSSLKRFKDNAREVTTGYECGVGLEGFNDFRVGDTLEFFTSKKAT